MFKRERPSSPWLLSMAVALVFGAPVAANAAPPKKPRPPVRIAWDVTVSIEQTAAWTIPRYEPFRDCYHRYYYAETGSDLYKISTRRAARVETLVSGRFGQLLPDPAHLDGFIPSAGWRKREVRVQAGWDAGDCGRAETGRPQVGDWDCGTRLPGKSVALLWTDGTLRLVISEDDRYVADNYYATFRSCPFRGPSGLSAVGFPYEALKAALPVKLMKRRRAFTVSRTTSYPRRGTETEKFPNGGEISASGKLSWTAKFTPAGR